jgi:hypothetical protein
LRPTTKRTTSKLSADNIGTIYFLCDGEPSDGTPEQDLDLVCRGVITLPPERFRRTIVTGWIRG